MARFSATTGLAPVISVLIAAPLVCGGKASQTEYAPDAMPLNESDLQEITLQVMQKNPLVSSSPGVKFAYAQRCCRSTGRSTDIANIVYFPHVESAGIKQAFQVRCERQVPNELWICGDVEIRRYLKLDSQDFEVRVVGEIETEAALALIQATRGTVQASATGGSGIPETAILIVPEGDSYMVTWGSPEGYEKLAVKARLRDGGSPTEPEAWETSVWEPKDQ